MAKPAVRPMHEADAHLWKWDFLSLGGAPSVRLGTSRYSLGYLVIWDGGCVSRGGGGGVGDKLEGDKNQH